MWKVFFALFFVLGGIMHFVKTEFYLNMMPPWIPFHRPAVFWSGIAEIALGIALLVPATSPWAAWGLIALLVAVFPANVQMLLNAKNASRGIKTMHWIRLPLQGGLIFWAYTYT